VRARLCVCVSAHQAEGKNVGADAVVLREEQLGRHEGLGAPEVKQLQGRLGPDGQPKVAQLARRKERERERPINERHTAATRSATTQVGAEIRLKEARKEEEEKRERREEARAT